MPNRKAIHVKSYDSHWAEVPDTDPQVVAHNRTLDYRNLAIEAMRSAIINWLLALDANAGINLTDIHALIAEINPVVIEAFDAGYELGGERLAEAKPAKRKYTRRKKPASAFDVGKGGAVKRQRGRPSKNDVVRAT